MRRWMWLVLAVGCNGGEGEKTDSGTTDSSTTPEMGPFWYGDLEPVVRQNCQGCHQPDGSGGFSLTTYEDATTWGPSMADAVAGRRMPPWLATDDGTCGEFRDSRWLNDDDLALFASWVDGGMPEGDASLAVSDPLPDLPSLDRVDLRLQTPDFVPQIVGGTFAQYDEYRCFLFENPTEDDVFITGFEVEPGNDAMVHHVIGMPVNPAKRGWYPGTTNQQIIEGMNGEGGRDGWPCFGTAGDGINESGYPVTWAPGMGAVSYPEGTGVRLKGSDWMVVQVHYNLVDPAVIGQADSTGIDLRLESRVDHELHFALPDGLLDTWFYGQPASIPPGESGYDYSWSISGDDVVDIAGGNPNNADPDFKIWGVMPHMHERGSKLRGEVGGECLVDVQDWNFEWQLMYLFDEPRVMAKSDQLDVTCTYDTSGDTEAVLPGWGTYNEMCLLTLMVSFD